jgi:hypothetical protein
VIHLSLFQAGNSNDRVNNNNSKNERCLTRLSETLTATTKKKKEG